MTKQLPIRKANPNSWPVPKGWFRGIDAAAERRIEETKAKGKVNREARS